MANAVEGSGRRAFSEKHWDPETYAPKKPPNIPFLYLFIYLFIIIVIIVRYYRNQIS